GRLDDLAGRPCHTTLAAPGTLEVSYNLAGNVTFFCRTPPVTLTVTRPGAGGGTVTSGSDIQCGSAGTHSYPPGTTVTLTAAPDDVSRFTGWSGPCSGTTATCSFTITADTSVQAEFDALATVTLTVTRSGAGGGSVSGGSGMDCGTTCTRAYLPGTQVTLTAAPDDNSVFSGWTKIVGLILTGGCTSTDTSCSFAINADTKVDAAFLRANLALEVLTGGGTHCPFGLCSSRWPGGTVTGTSRLATARTTS